MIQTLLRGENDSKQSDEIQANDFSLSCRHLWGSSYFVPPHKYLRNQEQHSFPKLSQSHCTFQTLEGSQWLQGNLIITWSVWNTGNALWPLINVRLTAAKVRFSQDFRILCALHNLSEGKKRRKKVTLGSWFYAAMSLWVVFSLSTLYFKTVDWSLTARIKQRERNVVLSWAGICGEGWKLIWAPLKVPA